VADDQYLQKKMHVSQVADPKVGICTQAHKKREQELAIVSVSETINKPSKQSVTTRGKKN
jgi:hypothetical protein